MTLKATLRNPKFDQHQIQNNYMTPAYPCSRFDVLQFFTIFGMITEFDNTHNRMDADINDLEFIVHSDVRWKRRCRNTSAASLIKR